MSRFSERHGYKSAPSAIQHESMSDELRHSIWSVLDKYFWSNRHLAEPTQLQPPVYWLAWRLWYELYKEPTDTLPKIAQKLVPAIRKKYYESRWNEIYDFLEVVADEYSDHEPLLEDLNRTLERELAGYRLVSGRIVPITDAQEVQLLDEALADDQFESVTTHLQRALELLSDRTNPDHRNSIKESISAVEAMARFITGKEKATLSEALTVLERDHKLHSSLKQGFSKLYGYTSDEGGIRHAMMEESELTAADAKYFLLSCTSFINYLKSKL